MDLCNVDMLVVKGMCLIVAMCLFCNRLSDCKASLSRVSVSGTLLFHPCGTRFIQDPRWVSFRKNLREGFKFSWMWEEGHLIW